MSKFDRYSDQFLIDQLNATEYVVWKYTDDEILESGFSKEWYENLCREIAEELRDRLELKYGAIRVSR